MTTATDRRTCSDDAAQAQRDRRRQTLADLFYRASLAAWDERWADAVRFAQTAQELARRLSAGDAIR